MFRLCCRWHVHVNSLWLWWYATIVVATHSYLMYRAVQQCKEYNELPWRSAEKPVAELYVYIILLVISMMCLPFFIITAVFKIGNYANDGTRLGRDDVDVKRLREAAGEERGGEEGRGQIMWRHFPPLCNVFHVVAAFALLLPKVLLDAQKIVHQFLPPGEIWASELDVIFGSNRPDPVPLDVSSGAADGFITNQNMSATTLAPPGEGSWNQAVLPVSPEFINWVLALIIYSLRYPAVYWYTKKSFSMVFAFLMFAAVFQYMFSYCAMGILYKYQANSLLYPDLLLLLPYQILIILYLLTNTFVFISSISLFNYGYYHYNESLRKFLAQNGIRRIRNKMAAPVGCQGYVPHSIATISLMLFVASRATVVYDAVSIYRRSDNDVILASIVWDVSYMLIWIITWFIFTIKQSWGFVIRSKVQPEVSTEVYTIRNQHVRDSALITGQVPGVEGTDHLQEAVNPSTDPGTDRRTTPPNSPTSALRKSGERRSGNAHVTFEENDVDGDVIMRESPRRRSKDKSRRKKQAESGEAPDERGGGGGGGGGGQSVFGGFPLEETPENTLTRSYRHSIRDKCGQYYRVARDFQSPPAAQSSPVLAQRADHTAGQYGPPDPPDDPAPNDPAPREMPPRDSQLRDPAPREMPPRDQHLRDPSPRDSQLRDSAPRDQHLRDPTPRDFPPRKPRSDTAHQRRSGSYEPDRPPRPEPRHPKPNTSIHTKHPPPGAERVLPPLPPHKTQGDPTARTKPRPNINYNQKEINPTNYVTNDVINYPPGMVRNNLNSKHPELNSKHPAPSPRDSGRNINRDIRLVPSLNQKPDMGRRDSALPSSNETSSNDSSDNVLCSQV